MAASSSSSPPAVPAMSLRARETSSMALKHIFDKINSSSHPSHPDPSGNRTNHAVDERHLFPLKRCFSDGRVNEAAKGAVASMAGQVQGASEDSRSAFRNPEQRTVRWKLGGEEDDATYARNADNSWPHRFQQGFLPQAASRPSSTNPVAKQPTAQLTIFYSGTVNVYDNVPADKANAIMLLAGTDSSNSRNMTFCSPPPEQEMIPQGTSSAATTRPSSSAIPSDNATPTSSSTRAINFTSLAPFMAGSPLMRPTMAVASPSPSTTVEAQTPTVPKRSHAGIELPHARKASLARFLEKRKDRIQVKPLGEEVEQPQENGELNVEKMPDNPNKKQCIESFSSPSPSREQ